MNARPDTDLFDVVMLRRRENGSRSPGLRMFATAVAKIATEAGWKVATLTSADLCAPDLLLAKDGGDDGRVVGALLIENDAAGLTAEHSRWVFPLFAAGVRICVWRDGDLDAVREELASIAGEMETAT